MRRMTNGSHPQQQPLTLQFGGLKSAMGHMISPVVLALFTVGMITAVANGKLLWLTIPLAVIFAIASLVLLTAVRRAAMPYGVVIDQDGIHTTQRDTITASFPWENITAAGMSYVMMRRGRIVKSGEAARTQRLIESGEVFRQEEATDGMRPSDHSLDLFCATPHNEVPTRTNEPGQPIRVHDDKSPNYGSTEGHLRIPFSGLSASNLESIRDSITRFGNNQLIEDHERSVSWLRNSGATGNSGKNSRN